MLPLSFIIGKKDRKIINSALAKKHRISELPATISKLIF